LTRAPFTEYITMAHDLTSAFSSLSDPTRAVVERLAMGPASVFQPCRAPRDGAADLMRHQNLEDCGLVRSVKKAAAHCYIAAGP
jgi:hypothetical protein